MEPSKKKHLIAAIVSGSADRIKRVRDGDSIDLFDATQEFIKSVDYAFNNPRDQSSKFVGAAPISNESLPAILNGIEVSGNVWEKVTDIELDQICEILEVMQKHFLSEDQSVFKINTKLIRKHYKIPIDVVLADQ